MMVFCNDHFLDFDILNRTRFGTGSVCRQVKRWRITYSVGFIGQSQSNDLDYYEGRPRFVVLL
jgi:hypothetical protein